MVELVIVCRQLTPEMLGLFNIYLLFQFTLFFFFQTKSLDSHLSKAGEVGEVEPVET